MKEVWKLETKFNELENQVMIELHDRLEANSLGSVTESDHILFVICQYE